MEWRHIFLDAEPPILILTQKNDKKRKERGILLHLDVATVLRSLRPANPKPTDLVFAGIKFHNTDQLQADMKAAGLTYSIRDGKKLTLRAFHAFRHTASTDLQNLPGVTNAAIEEFMRWSGPRMLPNYRDKGRILMDVAVSKRRPCWDFTHTYAHTITAFHVLKWHRTPKKG